MCSAKPEDDCTICRYSLWYCKKGPTVTQRSWTLGIHSKQTTFTNTFNPVAVSSLQAGWWSTLLDRQLQLQCLPFVDMLCFDPVSVIVHLWVFRRNLVLGGLQWRWCRRQAAECDVVPEVRIIQRQTFIHLFESLSNKIWSFSTPLAWV